MPEVDLHRYQLSDREHERIFREEIAPELLASGVSQRTPAVVFVGGQPGAGKTRTTAAVKAALARRGGAVLISGDLYKPYHPHYARLLAADDTTAGAYTRIDTRRWHAKAEAYVRERRCDAVIETAMADAAGFLAPAERFRAAGFRVEAAILAVPAAQSRLGILDRYGMQVQAHGHGRFVARANHDASYAGILVTADQLKLTRAADVVRVYRRGNHLLYANHLTPVGQWDRPPTARQAIVAERERPWTASETEAFTERLLAVAAILGPAWHTELASVARLARPLAIPDSTLALALEHGTAGITDLLERQPWLAAEASPPADPTAFELPDRPADRWLEEQELERDDEGWELP